MRSAHNTPSTGPKRVSTRRITIEAHRDDGRKKIATALPPRFFVSGVDSPKTLTSLTSANPAAILGSIDRECTTGLNPISTLTSLITPVVEHTIPTLPPLPPHLHL